jgi:heme-degrading monooxygenase HmoA
MISRYWRGLTRHEDADAYEAFLRDVLFPELSTIDGFIGGYVLRRDVAGGVEFVTLTQFASLEALRAFAGDDYERAVIRPKTEALLAEADECASHYQTVVDWRR